MLADGSEDSIVTLILSADLLWHGSNRMFISNFFFTGGHSDVF